MKGYTTGVVCGFPALLLWTIHPILSIMVGFVLPVVVLAFWTGVISIRFEKE